MIPFILGGVALAVTGYGIGKLFEDDDSSSKKSISRYSDSNSDLFDVVSRFEEVKSKLYRTTLIELQTALAEIECFEKNTDISICESIDNQSEFSNLSDDIEDRFDKYTNILETVQSFISAKFDKLDDLLMKSNNYEMYSEEEKELVEKLIDLNNIIVKATQSKMTLDGETISRDVRRAFRKIEMMIK